VLSKGAVAAVGAMPAAPELVAVALVPVARWAAAVGGLAGGRRLDPRLGDKLLVLPLALLQVKLAETGNIPGADAQAVTAGRDALRARFPGRVLDTQGLEQARPKVIEHRLARRLLDDGRQHVGRRGVV